MAIVYPYNEILPKRAAHDVFIFNECAALAELGIDVTLLCGKGSLPNEQLFHHYGIKEHAFQIERLPILRKNNPFNLSWNLPFFLFSQRYIRKRKPDWVFLSVRKQGAYHLQRKIPGVKYLYEVHELGHYPNCTLPQFASEKKMLQLADLITVTTGALKEILQAPPYSLTVPLAVVPLGVKSEPLPPPPQTSPLHIMYVGQLYTGQGLPTLLAALARTEDVKLTVVGGKPDEIEALKRPGVSFLGFVPPAQLASIAKEAHAFVAPFDRSGRMPYVAHTKLYEYASWGRPIIAPQLPAVLEDFQDKGALLYEPESVESLAGCINKLKNVELRQRLQQEIETYSGRFSWEARAHSYHALITGAN